MEILTASEIQLFRENGYLICKEVFSKQDALAMQKEIWNELEEKFEIKEYDSDSWRVPPQSPKNAKFSKLNEKLINAKFRTIISDLLGNTNWKEPSNWGGFLITFPTPDQTHWKLTEKIWHWDYELFRKEDLGGLLIFSFFSDVKPQGGGTLVVRGSHRLLRHYYHAIDDQQKLMKHGEQRQDFMKRYPWFNELTHPTSKSVDRKRKFMEISTVIEGIEVQVIELTGEPGDVVFCHPRLIHAGAGLNLRDYPRMMRVKFLW